MRLTEHNKNKELKITYEFFMNIHRYAHEVDCIFDELVDNENNKSLLSTHESVADNFTLYNLRKKVIYYGIRKKFASLELNEIYLRNGKNAKCPDYLHQKQVIAEYDEIYTEALILVEELEEKLSRYGK
ncbi:MAG: hypothetical protein FWG64_01770 [Firmicutes bacterium]|nr:hypothetical protein [Bacillota bacterium]